MKRILFAVLVMILTMGALPIVHAAPITDPTQQVMKDFYAIQVWEASIFKKGFTVEPDATGGDFGAKSQISGLPKVKLVSIPVDGSATAAETVLLSSDPNDNGGWTALSALATAAKSTDHYKVGASSEAINFLDTVDPNDPNSYQVAGAVIGAGNDDLTNNENVGCWLYSTVSLAAGDVKLLIDDTSADAMVNVPAVPAKKWTWVKMDISGVTASSKNVVANLGFVLSSAGAIKAKAAPFSIYVDNLVKWDNVDDDTLGVDILMDGMLSLVGIVNADAGTQVHTTTDLVEWTDYFIDYRSGADYIVWMTDQHLKNSIALVAY